jgi:hypothetical protein
MPADLYRDASLGIRARLAELEARIREREAEVTDAFWTSIEPDAREQLEALRERLEVSASGDATLEDLARAEGALSSYLDELEERIAALPALEEEWLAVPDEVPDPPAPRDHVPFAMPSAEERKDLVRAFKSTVRERDKAAEISADSPRSLLARFHDHGAPFALRATAHARGGFIAEVAMWLVTSVPRAMPRLTVRHESLALSFGKAFGIKHEVEVGEPSFDGLFVIEGVRETALQLLSPHVRGLLMTLARFDVPTLEVLPAQRIASLRWRFTPSAKALDAAVRVLASIRETHAEVRFRR